MEFGDKLQKMRKENNITQEGLADKLNVSRQAVSKWESGSAYPDTEKLIQISKIFHVSLDDLINNKEINKEVSSKKIDFMETIKIVSEFISKSFSMFWAMTFKEKIKCLFEMGFLVLIIFIMAGIGNMIVVEIIRRIFMFLPDKILWGLCNFIENILVVAWIVLGLIWFIKIFKSRYLDYYVVIEDEDVVERVKEEPIKELKEKKDYKVVIRDPKDSNFNLLNRLWKIILFGIKILAIFILVPLIITFIFFTVLVVISLSFLFSGLFFNGITIAILGALLFLYLIIEFIYNLIFNRKHNYRLIFALFIVAISLVGVGFGLSFVGLNNFEILEDTDIRTYEVDYSDNLVFDDIMDLDADKIVIDNSVNNIKMDVLDNDARDINIDTYTRHYDDNEYKIVNITYDYDDMDMFKKVIENLKEKKISRYYNGYEIDKVYISESHLTKLKENYNKFYK